MTDTLYVTGWSGQGMTGPWALGLKSPWVARAFQQIVDGVSLARRSAKMVGRWIWKKRPKDWIRP